MAAEMLYYLRDSKVPLYIWMPGRAPHNHFEMTRPFTAKTPEPILVVSLRPCPDSITRSFVEAANIGLERVRLVKDRTRMVYFCRLSGFKN